MRARPGVRRLGDDGGQVVPLLAILLLGLVVMVGLVTDAGLLFAARRDLQGVADGASRAGAMALDEQGLRESGRQVVRLNPDLARQRVEGYLDSLGFSGKRQIMVASQQVDVVLEQQRRTLVMGIAAIRHLRVKASSSARPRYGIDRPEG